MTRLQCYFRGSKPSGEPAPPAGGEERPKVSPSRDRYILYSSQHDHIYCQKSLLVVEGGMSAGSAPRFPREHHVSDDPNCSVLGGYKGISLGSIYPKVQGPGYVVPRFIGAGLLGGLGFWKTSQWIRGLLPTATTTATNMARSGSVLGRFLSGANALARAVFKPQRLLRFALPLLGGGLVGAAIGAAFFAKELYDLYHNIRLYRRLENPDTPEVTAHAENLHERCQEFGGTPEDPVHVSAVGHSGGGASLIAVANRANRSDSPWGFRIKKLILLDSPLTEEHLKNIPSDVEVLHLRTQSDNIYRLGTTLGPLIGLNMVSDPTGHLKPTDKVSEHAPRMPIRNPLNPSHQLFHRHAELLYNWDTVLADNFGRKTFRESVLQLQQSDKDFKATLEQVQQIQAHNKETARQEALKHYYGVSPTEGLSGPLEGEGPREYFRGGHAQSSMWSHVRTFLSTSHHLEAPSE